MSSHRSLILSSFWWTACLISAPFSLWPSDSGPADPALSYIAEWCGRPSWALPHSHLSLSLALLWMLEFCLSFLFFSFSLFPAKKHWIGLCSPQPCPSSSLDCSKPTDKARTPYNGHAGSRGVGTGEHYTPG